MHLNIFFPIACLEKKNGLLVGFYQEERNTYHIISVLPAMKNLSFEKKTFANTGTVSTRPQVLGRWIKNLEGLGELKWPNHSEKWLALMYCSGVITVVEFKPKQQLSYSAASEEKLCKHNCIFLYSKKDILHGIHLIPSIERRLKSCESKNKLDVPIWKPASCEDNGQNCHPLTAMCEVVDLSMVQFLFIKVDEYQKHYLQLEITQDKDEKPPVYSKVCQNMWKYVCHMFSFFLHTAVTLLMPINFALLKKLFCLSSIGSHIIFKFDLLYQLKYFSSVQRNHKRDIVFALLFDGILGMIFCYWILSSSLHVWMYMSEVLMPSVDVIGKQVEGLIRWLMGIPIGLKLNAPLNQFLGKFFLHHVRLWLEYIQMILSTFVPEGSMVAWPAYLCCFGFSFFLALISDIISLLAFHVFCFYVYAARLYGLQISGLMSFWRLFRGKKWNPLRNRVDTLPHSPDVANHRFFTGTLLFTILLFLLPTTALYYAIFAMLRVLMIIVQSSLRAVRQYLACFPLYSLILRVVKPSVFAVAARFNKIDMFVRTDYDLTEVRTPFGFDRHTVENLMVVEMVFDVKSWKSIISESVTSMHSSESSSHSGLQTFLSKLISGRLM